MTKPANKKAGEVLVDDIVDWIHKDKVVDKERIVCSNDFDCDNPKLVQPLAN